jgi:hypothetical protein
MVAALILFEENSIGTGDNTRPTDDDKRKYTLNHHTYKKII